jgi:hypothetical protein
MLLKNILFMLLLLPLLANAQKTPQQMQHVIGKTLLEQKAWQQSKLPGLTVFKGDYMYKLPLFRSNLPYYASEFPWENNNTAPRRLKLNYTYSINPQPNGVTDPKSFRNWRTFKQWHKHLQL